MDVSNQEVIGELAREVSEDFRDIGLWASWMTSDQGKTVSIGSFLNQEVCLRRSRAWGCMLLDLTVPGPKAPELGRGEGLYRKGAG